jgi:ABC-type dipeptide/oligopeptide/nickel transport system permease component
MTLWRFLGRRLVFAGPQLLGILLATFILVRILPGDPVSRMTGGLITPQAREAMIAQLGLDKPLHVQFLQYLGGALHGNLGTSWRTSNPVTLDIANRFPATFELITLGLAVAVVFFGSLGICAALRPGGAVARLATVYGSVAGAFPEFWIGLMLIFFCVYRFHVLPYASGQFDAYSVPPPLRVTGMYFFDSLLTGNLAALRESVLHLILPVSTLALFYGAPVLKMSRVAMSAALHSEFMFLGRACGLRRRILFRYALRNALPPIVTLIGVLYGFLLGGAVLVEVVYGWGGFGQYAVDSILNADYAPVQAFVLVSATFSLIVYLVMDILYFVLDPRIRTP